MTTSDQDQRGDGANVCLCFVPMFHIFGLAVITFAQLQRGNTVVVMSSFAMDTVMRAVERYRVTHLLCVPPVMIALAKQGMSGSHDLSSLRFILSAAAPLGKDVMEVVAKNFPNADIVQVSCPVQLHLAVGNWKVTFKCQRSIIKSAQFKYELHVI
jgi:4-coumarate--CoA ligase